MRPDITIRLRRVPLADDRSEQCYRVAGNTLIADCSMRTLRGFRQRCRDHKLLESQIETKHQQDSQTLIFRGLGWVRGRNRWVSCAALPGGYQIALEDIGRFGVSEDGAHIACLEWKPQAGFDEIEEAALGPAFILALALRGTWCLHGSAVVAQQQAVLFLGESGKGKSTLARMLTTAEKSWGTLGDDMLPVRSRAGQFQALPHFPQLKLPAGDQPSRYLPETLPIRGIFILRRPEDGENSVAIRPLQPQEGALALVRHTVAARLFDKHLLAKHFDSCVQLSKQIPVKELIYPLEADALSMVNKALGDDLKINAG